MGTRVDCTNEFKDSESKALEYPLCLVRKQAFHHTLDAYKSALEQPRVLDPSHRSIFLWDLVEMDGVVSSFVSSDQARASAHEIKISLSKDPDPSWRFVFIQSKTSRNAIGASREQLSTILTHHQVMPSFLDIVIAFRAKERPIPYAIFRHENYLEADSASCFLPGMKRSGIQIQHAFNLLSVERTDSQTDLNQWPLRQTGLYYSFDVETGKTVFIVMKGDNAVRRTIVSAVSTHRDLQPRELSSKEASFIGGLQVHLILFEWCAAYWGTYIDDTEEKVDQESDDVRTAPLDEMTMPQPLEYAYRRSTMETMHTRQSTFRTTRQNSNVTQRDQNRIPARTPIPEGTPEGMQSATVASPAPIPQSQSAPALTRQFSELVRRLSRFQSRAQQDMELGMIQDGDGDSQPSQFGPEEKFVFEKFQALNVLGGMIKTGLMAIEQNRGVLNEVVEQYRHVQSSDGFMANIDSKKCSGAITHFFRRINTLIRELDIQHSRLVSLSGSLENDKAAYQAALNYQSSKVSEHFSHNARVTSDEMKVWTKRMHRIAEKTERETVSMHLITLLTLIFLPGTFLATFFSSGVFQWNEERKPENDWITRPDGLKLFMKICIPMMAAVLGVWGVLYYLAWRRRRLGEKKKEGEDGVLLDLQERELMSTSLEHRHIPVLHEQLEGDFRLQQPA